MNSYIAPNDFNSYFTFPQQIKWVDATTGEVRLGIGYHFNILCMDTGEVIQINPRTVAAYSFIKEQDYWENWQKELNLI